MGDYEETCVECSRLAKENAGLKRQVEFMRALNEFERETHRLSVKIAREQMNDGSGFKDRLFIFAMSSLVSVVTSLVCFWLLNL